MTGVNISLSGKIAVVTGASRGIGRAIAIKLARAGAHVVINCARGIDKANEVAAEINQLKSSGQAPASAGATVMQFDISKSDSVEKAFEEIYAKHGAVHVLVNNAGIARDGLIIRAKDEDWDETINTNLKGAFLCSRAVARNMMKAREGSIINMTSVVGQKGNAGQTIYSASKAGLIGFTKSLAVELAARNIRVNAVAPGFIDTEMTKDLPETAKTEMLADIPSGAMGSAENVADAVLWLASTESAYVTGQVLNVNGGMYS